MASPTPIFECTPERHGRAALEAPPPAGPLEASLAQMTVRVRVRLGTAGGDGVLAAWGDGATGGFALGIRRAGERPEERAWDDLQQNYLAFPEASGACTVLEASLALRNHNPAWSRLRVGVPVARLGRGRMLDVVLRFSGASLCLWVDGVPVDEEWPVGVMPVPTGPLRTGGAGAGGDIENVTVWPVALAEARIMAFAGGAARVAERTVQILGPENPRAQYWTPRGHNQWVGDAMLDEAPPAPGEPVRLFYLIDRRHGASKFGCGAHSVSQLASRDLAAWEAPGTAFGLEAWETVGTGRPIRRNGQVVLFYGLHTSRILPGDRLVEAAVVDGQTVPRDFPDAPRAPQGTSLAVSDDGVTFRESRRLVHPAQNPAVFRDASAGGWLMLAGYGTRGLWHSEDLERWTLVDPHIIPINEDSPTRNSDECQCWFEWNGWHYIIGGRTGFWMSRHQRGPYWEGKDQEHARAVVRPRWDIYDGLWVPMVASLPGNRRLMAGFLQGPDYDWAGHLVFRELVALEDGTLGLKWPAELTPPVQSWTPPALRCRGQAVADDAVAVTGSPASWASLETPAAARLSLRVACSGPASQAAIAFLDEAGTGGVLSFVKTTRRVQWNAAVRDGLPGAVATLTEILNGDDHPIWALQHPHLPFRGANFAITDVDGLDRAFRVEVLFFHDPKSRSTIIDACIDGQRTLITRRKGLKVAQLRLLADGPYRFEEIRMGTLAGWSEQ